MNLWYDDFVHINPYSRPGLKLGGVQYLVWHYTANPGATAEGHQDYFDRNDLTRYAGAHIFIDKDSANCLVPLDELAYHAGNTWYNQHSIGIELCIEKDGAFHPDTIDRAVKIGAELCKRFKLNPQSQMIRHYDVTKKICPKPWVDNPSLFVQFKNNVSSELKPYVHYVTGGFQDGSASAKEFEAFMKSKNWWYKKEDQS